MYQDSTHEHHDLSMELLCSLPMTPYGAKMSVLAEDLGVNQKTLRDLIQVVGSEHGVGLVVWQQDGYVVGVDGSSWAKAVRMGQRYWKKVYGEVAA